MSIILRFLGGMVIMVIGFLVVSKTQVFREWFGEIPWAEKTFGSGGTLLFYKLLGVLICFLGITFATNLIQGIIGFFLSFFFRTV